MNTAWRCNNRALWISTVTCLMSITAAGAAAESGASQANMLIYLADDHSIRDSSLYGATDIDTPHMERLAAEGMTFHSAFVASPACAPSRAALLTGLMPARNGAEANHTYPRPGIKKLPAYLHEAGYEVAAFGKVAHGRSAADYGFDHIEPASDVAMLRKNVRNFLASRRSDRPLCLFVGTSNPHVLWPEETTIDPHEIHLPPTFVDTPLTRRQRARYYQEVKDLDELLGDLRELAARHLGEDCLFAYSSDHGAQWPFGKWTLYDDGIHVPLIVVQRGRIEAGSSTDALVSWVDLLPTLVDLAGGTPPSDLDGFSFADVLKGTMNTHRAEIFATHTGDGNKNIYPSRCIRTGRWKYIRNLHPEYAFTTHIDFLIRPGAGIYWTTWLERAESDPRARAVVDRYHRRPAEELYCLPADPHEMHNVADEPANAAVLDDLRLRLDAWMKRQGDQQQVHHQPYLLSEPETWPVGKFVPPGSR